MNDTTTGLPEWAREAKQRLDTIALRRAEQCELACLDDPFGVANVFVALEAAMVALRRIYQGPPVAGTALTPVSEAREAITRINEMGSA